MEISPLQVIFSNYSCTMNIIMLKRLPWYIPEQNLKKLQAII